MSKITFTTNQIQMMTTKSISKATSGLLLPLAILSTSMLTLSCKSNDSADASSRESRNNREENSRTAEHKDARPAKVSKDRSTSMNIEEREEMHQKTMLKIAMDDQSSDEEREKAFNKALHQWVNDPVLFGERRYASADQVKDKKVDFYLPAKATQIQLLKEANGHCALYKISEEDFKAHLEKVWQRYREDFARDGKRKWIKYDEEQIARELQPRQRGTLKFVTHKQAQENGYPFDKEYVRVPKAVIDSAWQAPQNTVVYSGPYRSNGGGVTWYYDRDAGVVFQDVGYW